MKEYKLSFFYKNKIIMFIIALVFLLQTSCYLGENSVFVSMVSMLSYVLCLVILILYFVDFQISKFSLALLIFTGALIFSSVLSSTGNVILCITKYLPIVCLIMYLEKCLIFSYKNCIQVISNLLLILIFINFYTIIRYPKGLYLDDLYSNNWFFKYDNMHSFIYFPGLLLSYLSMKYDKKNIVKFVLVLFMSTYCVYYCRSANTVVAYTIFLLYLLLKKFMDNIEILNTKNYFITYIILFFSMVIFRIQNIFDWLIVGILKKDLTFTGRTIIWNRVIEYIKISPIFGYGIEKGKTITAKLGNVYYAHAHNTFLDVLYKGGMVGFALFIYLLYIVVKKLYKYKKYSEAKFTGMIILNILIMTVFEAREDRIGLYIILLFGYYIDKIVQEIYLKNKCEKEGD